MRGLHLGRSSQPIGGVILLFTVVEDICYITYGIYTYTLPVVYVGTSLFPSGSITAQLDVLHFHYNGQTWGAPAVAEPAGDQVPGAYIVNDTLYVTISITTYSTPVAIGFAPLPITPGTTLVTGSDGAEYEKTTYSDGTIRYKPVYEELP